MKHNRIGINHAKRIHPEHCLATPLQSTEGLGGQALPARMFFHPLAADASLQQTESLLRSDQVGVTYITLIRKLSAGSKAGTS